MNADKNEWHYSTGKEVTKFEDNHEICGIVN